MPKLDLGPIGAVITSTAGDVLETAVAVEALGYAAVWVGGPSLDLDTLRQLVKATSRITVATGILSIDAFTAPQVQALYDELEAEHPGRFVLGLGGAHSGRPLPRINAYLDELRVPRERLVLAALGPKMLELARDRAGGAFPVLVTPDYVTRARDRVGRDITLAVDQMVVVDEDPDSARAAARGPLSFLGSLPQYQRHFARMGFSDDDIETRSNALVDALVAWGSAAGVAARVRSVQRSGADHVALSAVAQDPKREISMFEALAAELL